MTSARTSRWKGLISWDLGGGRSCTFFGGLLWWRLRDRGVYASKSRSLEGVSGKSHHAGYGKEDLGERKAGVTGVVLSGGEMRKGMEILVEEPEKSEVLDVV